MIGGDEEKASYKKNKRFKRKLSIMRVFNSD